jgi:TetR/AcrR family transcriptional repressor of nem operon
MLAADYATLPEAMRERVRRFFEANDSWLTRVLSRGLMRQEIDFRGTPAENARLLIGALEGAMLLARSFEGADRFHALAETLLGRFAPQR